MQSNKEILQWDPENTSDGLTISPDGTTLSWGPKKESDTSQKYDPAWLCSQTTALLTDSLYSWDFIVIDIASRQIGVGIMLSPPNWGFYGYLGAGHGAWSYDAFEGAIVTETNAIMKDLPCIDQSGVVSVFLDLKDAFECMFSVNGKSTPSFQLPKDCSIIPAATLLKIGQVVRLANFKAID